MRKLEILMISFENHLKKLIGECENSDILFDWKCSSVASLPQQLSKYELPTIEYGMQT